MDEDLKIIGLMCGDYFQIRCAECKVATINQYRGGDPAVPFFTARCEKCGKKSSWKLEQPGKWKGLPLQAHA